MYRVAEAALNHKWKALNAPKNIRSFKNRLIWLKDNNHLSEIRFNQWDAGRSLRNMASHPDRQSIYAPPDALGTIEITVELIEDLFKPTDGDTSARPDTAKPDASSSENRIK